MVTSGNAPRVQAGAYGNKAASNRQLELPRRFDVAKMAEICVHSGKLWFKTNKSARAFCMVTMDVKGILERLRAAAHVETDSQLSEKIGVPYQTISSWKKRGSIPIQEILRTAELFDISLDWLLNGVRHWRDNVLNATRDDRTHLLAVRYAIETSGLSNEKIEDILRNIKLTKRWFSMTLDDLINQQNKSEEEAFKIIERRVSDVIGKEMIVVGP